MAHDYDRTRTASISIPSPDPNSGYLTIWIEIESFGPVHHVTGDIIQASKNLDPARMALVAAQREFMAMDLMYDTGAIVVNGSKNKGRNKMVVAFSVTPVGKSKFSDIELGMLMGKLKGVSKSEKKSPSV